MSVVLIPARDNRKAKTAPAGPAPVIITLGDVVFDIDLNFLKWRGLAICAELNSQRNILSLLLRRALGLQGGQHASRHPLAPTQLLSVHSSRLTWSRKRHHSESKNSLALTYLQTNHELCNRPERRSPLLPRAADILLAVSTETLSSRSFLRQLHTSRRIFQRNPQRNLLRMPPRDPL